MSFEQLGQGVPINTGIFAQVCVVSQLTREYLLKYVWCTNKHGNICSSMFGVPINMEIIHSSLNPTISAALYFISLQYGPKAQFRVNYSSMFGVQINMGIVAHIPLKELMQGVQINMKNKNISGKVRIGWTNKDEFGLNPQYSQI